MRKIYKDRVTKRMRAVNRIQTYFRNFKHKIKEPLEQKRLQNKAATLIQKFLRGYLYKRKMEQSLKT